MTVATSPAICISCPHVDAGSLMGDPEIVHLRDETSHLFELRLDRMRQPSPTALEALVAWLGPRRVIVTCRSAREGGHAGVSPGAPMNDRLRLHTLDVVAEFGPLYLDLELADVQRLPDTSLRLRKFRRAGAKLLISVHAQGAVSDGWLREQRDLAQAYGADLIKIVLDDTTVSAPFQSLWLARESTAARTPLLTFAMGLYGQFTRLLSDHGDAPSPLVFACLHAQPAVAAGQLSWKTMQRAYRTPGPCRVYGILGSPVAHSLSPVWHQNAFFAHDDRARYVPCEVRRGQLEEFLTFAKFIFAGFSVTMPHKLEAAALAATVSPMVSRTAVANTLRLGADNLWAAENTDAPAVVRWLQQKLVAGSLPSRVLVVGSGGFAVSVIEAACALGAVVYICGRNQLRLDFLTKKYNATVVEADAIADLALDAIVNATPLGMPGPLYRETCLPLHSLGRSVVLFDGVYQGDPLTPWLREGQGLGHQVVTGWWLFCEQANLQRAFWGFEPLSPAEALSLLDDPAARSVDCGSKQTI